MDGNKKKYYNTIHLRRYLDILQNISYNFRIILYIIIYYENGLKIEILEAYTSYIVLFLNKQ